MTARRGGPEALGKCGVVCTTLLRQWIPQDPVWKELLPLPTLKPLDLNAGLRGRVFTDTLPHMSRHAHHPCHMAPEKLISPPRLVL